jgi:uncharacterized metal-binding protein YceD (DUF177 family)
MNAPVPEFSRPVAVSRIPPNGIEEHLEAKPLELTALAKRFDLVELKYLKADLSLTPEAKHSFIVTGRINAKVTQLCVVTLEPLQNVIALDVDITFIPEEDHRDGSGSPFPDEKDEEFEVFSNGKIDLGEMVAQQLGVNIDPYPRKADAALPATSFGTATVEKRRPLADLATVLKKIDDKTND